MNEYEWLVAIVLKTWKPDMPPDWKHGPRTVTYIEVVATNEFAARHAGHDEFRRRAKYEPITRRVMETYRLTTDDVAASEAVCIS
jgi:hypothetical protein